MAVFCNPIRMGRWSELMVACVCHSDEVIREADANDTSGELGSALPWSLVGESVFRTAGNTDRIRQLIASRIGCSGVPEWMGSLLGLVNLCLSASGRLVVNNAIAETGRGDVHVGNKQLCIIHSDADGQFF